MSYDTSIRAFSVQAEAKCAIEIHHESVPLAHIVLDPAELDPLIRRLGTVREALSDPVGMDLDPGSRVVSVVDPVWRTSEVHQDEVPDGVLLALRHPGLGWLGFVLPLHEARSLANSLAILAEPKDPANMV